MDESIDRQFLVTEILILEELFSQTGSANADLIGDRTSLELLPTSDLRAIKTRLERLSRSLGGVKR